MWNFPLLPALLLAGSLIASTSATAATSISRTFSNAVLYQFDTDGNAIDLTSAKIDYLGGAYIWYGLPKSCGEDFCGVSSYSSTDLKTWKFNGLLFDPNTAAIQALCLAPLSGTCPSSLTIQPDRFLNQSTLSHPIFLLSSQQLTVPRQLWEAPYCIQRCEP